MEGTKTVYTARLGDKPSFASSLNQHASCSDNVFFFCSRGICGGAPEFMKAKRNERTVWKPLNDKSIIVAGWPLMSQSNHSAEAVEGQSSY